MLAIVHAQTNNFVGIGDRRPQFQRVERQEPTPGLELRLRPGKDLLQRLLPLLEKRTHGEVCLPAGHLRTTQEISPRINRRLPLPARSSVLTVRPAYISQQWGKRAPGQVVGW